MKRTLLGALFMVGSLVLTGPAWSGDYFVGSTNVGGLDSFVASINLGSSSEATEARWIADSLGVPSVEMTKIEANPWQSTDTKGVYAWDLGDFEPVYFYVKLGNTGKGSPSTFPDHWLFKNVSDLNWGVIELAGEGYDNVNIGKVSHVGFTSVPEPATLALLGFGLIGVGWTARRSVEK